MRRLARHAILRLAKRKKITIFPETEAFNNFNDYFRVFLFLNNQQKPF